MKTKKFRTLQSKIMIVMSSLIVAYIIITLLLHIYTQSIHAILISSISSFIFLVIILYLLIRRYITRPASIVLKVMNSGDVNLLSNIRSERIDDEWDLIAEMIIDYYEKSKKLRSELDSKNKFFDIIAHDLRSPFNSIIGILELLVNNQDDYSQEEKNHLLISAFKAAKNNLVLLDSLLKWARLQTGRWLPNKRIFDFAKIVYSVYTLYKVEALQRDISLVSNIKDSILVYGDEDMIETILRNLVSNAIKFTQKHGLVTIDVCIVDNYLQVKISDNGKGMSPKVLNNLFKIGENVVSVDIKGDKGTGLGLVLSQDLVIANSGKIWAESQLNKGSDFYFTIPLSN